MVIDFHVKDTQADGKAAALCVTYISKINTSLYNHCEIINHTGKGTYVKQTWFIDATDRVTVWNAIGSYNKLTGAFHAVKSGPHHKIR
jgi:hypothetical protein